MKKRIYLSLFLLLFGGFQVIAQDTCWTALLIKKGKNLKVREDMSAFNYRGFYLYRNCIYNVSTKENEFYRGRLIDIKPDTLFFTKYLNEAVAQKAGKQLDTVAIHYKELDKLHLFRGRNRPTYKEIPLTTFDFIFKKQAQHCVWESLRAKIFENSDKVYEIVPHLEMLGITGLFEDEGKTYFFTGVGGIKQDKSKIDTTYRVKNIFGFLPTKADKINGLAIGAFASNFKQTKDNEYATLKINGLCIEFMPLSWWGFVGLKEKAPDSTQLDLESDVLNGLGVSFDKVSVGKMNGLQVSVGFNWIEEVRGVCVSSVRNFTYKCNGVSIASMNKSFRTRGVQIGLYNKATDLRGFQFGLWNVNGKRSLPFINWQFGKNKRRKKRRKQREKTGK
ncbi:hypothetical protein BKI52_07850 [marine bacterium AO1-C]|nr:hypothetical protein BKI52_07850 [marine bacterium AO1-C]